MPRKKILKAIDSFIDPYRVTRGKNFRLKDFDPADTHGLMSEQKPQAKELLARGVEWLAELQDKLYAQDSWALLLVFQAMDAAGKDGTIKHVMSGVNPQGCQVFSFKVPSAEELDHDYLWRYAAQSARARAHRHLQPLLLRGSPRGARAPGIPRAAAAAAEAASARSIWKQRFADIAGFEDYLGRNGTRSLKFFLHVSRKEQKRRFLERLDMPEKNWKFSTADVTERALLGRLHEGLRAGDTRNGHRATRRGTWSPPTTSGSRGSSSRPRSSTPWNASISRTRRSTRRSARSFRVRGGSCRTNAVADGRGPILSPRAANGGGSLLRVE